MRPRGVQEGSNRGPRRAQEGQKKRVPPLFFEVFRFWAVQRGSRGVLEGFLRGLWGFLGGPGRILVSLGGVLGGFDEGFWGLLEPRWPSDQVRSG